MVIRFALMGACASAAALATPLAAAVPDYISIVVSQMNDAISDRSAAGWDFRQGEIGMIDRGESFEHVLRTDWMKTTEVRAWCDGDCNDVDIEVRDSNGNVVASDFAVDDHPVVSFEPQPGLIYRARIAMANCSQDPCYYSMATFTPR